MEFREFTAGKDDDGRRFDRILRIFLTDLSLGEIYKLLRKGLIKLNNKKAKADSHVKEGDLISIAAFLLEKNNSDKNTNPLPDSYDKNALKIVFENKEILIIDKPYGRTVHGSENEKLQGLEKEVTAYYNSKKDNKASDSLAFRPGPLHRLDRNTSGLLAFSMSLKGAQWFSEGIKNHTISKKYYGLAEGRLEEKEEWQDKLTDSQAENQTFHTVTKDENGQLAITVASPLAYGHLGNIECTLVEYAIKTGRKHQIRIQSQLHGHSLAGDKAYGGHKDKNLKREYYLQAYSLTFPEDNPLELPQEIKIGLSPDFKTILEYCEIKNPGL